MANKIQIRRDTTAHWAAADPILSQGELGLDTTLNKMKIGNGTSQWSALSFFIGDTGATGATGPQGNVGPAGVTELSELVNGTAILSLDATGDLTLADNGGIVFDRAHTSIRVGMGFHIASGEGISLEAINDTDPNNLITKGWYFSPSGGITFPTLSVDIHNGGVQSVQVLKFDDTTQQVIITGPTPAAGNSAERIIIQGQRATGRNSINNQDAEGGDVYLWGGDSDYDGGDIKIYAGDADSNDINGSIGGYVNISAGNGFTNGGHLTLSAGVANALEDGYGGNVSIAAGYAPNGTPGNIQLNTYSQADSANLAWTFTNDGKLQLPAGGDIVNEFGTSVLSSTDVYRFASGVIGTRGELTTLGNSMLGGFPIILDPSGESDARLYIPSVSQQVSGTALQITNKGAANSIVQVFGWGGVQLVTNTGLAEKVFEFNDNGSLSFPKGSNVSETSNTVAIAPPTAAAGQSLVIRPTTVAWGLAASGYIVYGSPMTVSVTTIGGSSYFGTVNYTFSGCTAEQLGRALTGQITFPGGNTGNPQTITWTIPANSNITTFTLTLGSAVGVFGTDFNFELNGLPDGQFVTVTNNGITNSEFSHVHLVAGNPATVDIYLGDDDQYVKIEKNAGDVVIGTNLDTHQWTFDITGKLNLPGSTFIDTSPNYIHANHGIGLHPSHNTGGTGPELYIYYDDGIVVQPFTNDYITSGNAASPLFITGSNLPNTNDSIGKLPGDIYIKGGRNVKDETYGKVVVNSGTNQWKFNSSGQLIFPDTTIQTTAYREPDVTNQFYVDPFASTNYTPTGSILKPFRTIAAAQAQIEARITATTLLPGELNPIFIVLTGSITENVTLTRGHVFLTTLNGSIHTPIYLTGQVTINGDNTSAGAIDANHFAITGLTIVGPVQGACIYFTGTNAQRLQVQDLWLTARGNQTGNTPFVDAGGYGIYSDNSGVRASDGKHSPVHGSDIKVSHNGTGDVYCFRFSNGSTGEFANVETSGATQVGAAGTGSLLAFTNSTLDANGEVILEAYGTGSISVNNCIMSNAYTGVAYGIWLQNQGGNALIINSIISVASSNAASRMIKGHATELTGVFYNNIMVGKSTTYPYPDLNKKVDNTVILTAITGAAGLTSVSP